MRFSATHEFPGSPRAVADILCDPAFHAALVLPDLSLPEIVEHSADGLTRVLRLRYTFVGHLDPVARRILAGRTLTWVQELQLDVDSGVGRLTFTAEAEPGRLYGAADVALTALDDPPTRTRRTIAGDFYVKVPLVGGTAERRIVPGLVRRLDVEAEALTAALSSP